MLLTQLNYFEALARERHFGRAAASCFVTTSTLSEAIRKLETEVGTPLVNRSHSAYQGLTAEGELVLGYARRITADQRHLTEDLAAARGELDTTVRIGVIPAGTGPVAEVMDRLGAAHPKVRFDLQSGLRSEEVVEGLRAHRLDAGLIHTGPDSELTRGLTLTTLGTVRFEVAATGEMFRRHLGSVPETLSGQDLARLPLALLAPGMLAREAFDRAMQDTGLAVTPVVDTDSVGALQACAASGRWFGVVPERTPGSEGLCTVELVEPEVCLSIAVARLDTRPVPAVATAVDEAAAAVSAAAQSSR